MFKVLIKSYINDEVIEEFKSYATEREAERLERGVNINLNHDEYYTEIVEVY